MIWEVVYHKTVNAKDSYDQRIKYMQNLQKHFQSSVPSRTWGGKLKWQMETKGFKVNTKYHFIIESSVGKTTLTQWIADDGTKDFKGWIQDLGASSSLSKDSMSDLKTVTSFRFTGRSINRVEQTKPENQGEVLHWCRKPCGKVIFSNSWENPPAMCNYIYCITKED